jgi:co-chaperonin GroES (HSP10)
MTEEESINETKVHPAGFLVLVKTYVRRTSNGIIIPDSMVKDQKLVSAVGQLVEVGPDAFMDGVHTSFPNGPRAKVGDYVIYPRYNGARIDVGDDQYRLINDDEILAVTDDPTSFRI